MSSLHETGVKPPVAEKIKHSNFYHNSESIDEYHWIRDDLRKDEKVLDHLKKEFDYSESVMNKMKPLQEKLYGEFLSKIQEDDSSVPTKHFTDDNQVYYYYSKTIKGENYSLQCRKKGSLEAQEEVLLDLNKDKEHKYISLGGFEPSNSHKFIAISIDYSGHEDYLTRFLNTETGEYLSDEIADVTSEIVWSKDDSTVFYVKMDKAHRPHQIWRHEMGKSEDVMIFEENDTKFSVRVSKTSDDKFIIVGSGSSTTSEKHYVDAADPTAPLKVVQKRINDVLYSVDHFGENQFVIRTNGEKKNATDKPTKIKNFRIVTVPSDGSSSTDMENWREIFSSPDVYINGIQTFKNFLTCSERSQGLGRLRVFNPQKTGNRLEPNTPNELISFDEEDYSVYMSESQNFKENIMRIRYNSWITPTTVIDVNLNTSEKTVMKVNPVPNYDKSQYESKVIWSKSEDGVEVPVTLTYRKDLYQTFEGKNPCLLYGYGSYGICMDPRFTVTTFSLLDRGFIYAVAKIRGGSEMGRSWYEDQGKFLTKKNTFTDFVSAGRELVRAGYTKHEWMAISGASAGGLLVGAVLNLAPDLCKSYVANVPFVDVVNTMWDETIPLTTGEFEEWGNPKDKEYYDYMLSYSPYDNLRKGVQYPNGRVTAGIWDSRVAYWEPTKWVAKMRDYGVTHGADPSNPNPSLLIYECQMSAGHFASTGRYDWLKDKAKDMAFIIKTILPESE